MAHVILRVGLGLMPHLKSLPSDQPEVKTAHGRVACVLKQLRMALCIIS